MTMTELQELTRAEWLASLWPLYLIAAATLIGAIGRRL